MNIKNYFTNEKELNKKYDFFISKNQLIKKEGGKNLVLAHIKKAEHNLKFLETIDDEFIDWKIVVLYYSLYHSCLALVKNKNYDSKNHSATLIFLIKNYSQITDDEINFINDFEITKEDAQFYTNLKNIRHIANYSTNLNFSKEEINIFKIKTLKFLNKIKEILEK